MVLASYCRTTELRVLSVEFELKRGGHDIFHNHGTYSSVCVIAQYPACDREYLANRYISITQGVSRFLRSHGLFCFVPPSLPKKAGHLGFGQSFFFLSIFLSFFLHFFGAEHNFLSVFLQVFIFLFAALFYLC